MRLARPRAATVVRAYDAAGVAALAAMSRLDHFHSFHPPITARTHGPIRHSPITINCKLHINPTMLVESPLRIVDQILRSDETITSGDATVTASRARASAPSGACALLAICS